MKLSLIFTVILVSLPLWACGGDEGMGAIAKWFDAVSTGESELASRYTHPDIHGQGCDAHPLINYTGNGQAGLLAITEVLERDGLSRSYSLRPVKVYRVEIVYALGNGLATATEQIEVIPAQRLFGRDHALILSRACL